VNRDARALELFEACLVRDASARAAFLDIACAGDVALRTEVDRLLTADSAAEDFLAEPIQPSPRRRDGERVGVWQIEHELGRGGMGTVYLARRADALYDKRVALKALRIDAPDLRARFANERRILAALEHPNIARLLDAGVDAHDMPYVVMDFVEGEPITRWCDAHAPGAKARVALFLKVLDAVQYAHGRLVVHRDLKPANILVDGDGEPKLLDFGIAKLMGEGDFALTETGFAPLTPEYASPEQIRGEPIGTASDIYALGVLLYELLAGTLPHATAGLARGALERVICETEPMQPSIVAARSGRGRLDHDLDHVVLRAMAKSPRDRYASCAQLADDLERYVRGEPVVAANAGFRHRAAKFVRRNRVPVAIGAAIVAALVAGTLVTLRQARIARSERDRAAEISQFLQDMLAAADPNERGRDVSAKALVDDAARTLAERTHGDAGVETALRVTLAGTYKGLGELDAALDQARAAAASAGAAGEVDAGTRAQAFEVLAEVLQARSQEAEAAQWAERAAAFDDPQATAWVGQAENLLGIIARHQGKLEEAGRHYQRALGVYREGEKIPEAHVAVVLSDLGVLRIDQGDPHAAVALQEQAVAIMRRVHPQAHPQTAAMLSALADARALDHDYAGAEAAFKETLAIRTTLLGESHPDTLFSMVAYASLLNIDLHRYAEGEALARHAWDLGRAHLPDPHQQTAYAGITLADALMHLGRPEEAVPVMRETYAMRCKLLPATSPVLLNTESLLGAALAESGNAGEGEPLMRDAVDRLNATVGEKNSFTLRAVERLATSVTKH
jgi:serine/threonine-protein kinase